MEDAGQQAWAAFFELMRVLRGRMEAVAQRFELTPVQAHILLALERHQQLPMSGMAQELGCDASNVTGLVDRLETRGFIARQPAEHDRRVKMLVLTEEGARMGARVREALRQTPEPIARLSPEDQRALRDILRRALG